MVDAARSRGVDVLLDQYPYTAYQTSLMTIALPTWVQAGTPEALAERLRDPDTRARVRASIDGIDFGAVELATVLSHPEYSGCTIQELAVGTDRDPRDWLLDLLSEGGPFPSAVHHALSEDDVERVLSDPRVMIGSDAVAASPGGPGSADKTHPRTYGAFARVLARYAREKGLLSWPEAVRRMTSLPASRLGWADRGRVAVGCVADLVVFDPKIIADVATFAAPHALAVGVQDVVVSGTIAWAGGRPTGARPGRVLRRA
jgi:N-acyl-D-amino-acid deacylase